MNWYTVDESGSTHPCGVLEYFEWHAAMPESSSWYASKTGCGFSIASDVLESGIRVSTVYLGLNHAYGDGPPLLWETMTFPGCDICERYSSVEQAIEGHKAICKEAGK
jgi:hypothetical protein